MAGGGGVGGRGEGAVIGDAVNNTDVVRTMIAINVSPPLPHDPHPHHSLVHLVLLIFN